MPLVSIVVPYYKKKLFISECLKSIHNQTYKHYEIILVYDDEDPRDYEYLLTLKKIYKKLFIIKNKKRQGAGGARNLGIKFAKGDYIAFLDSDDMWHKQKLKIQINLMKKNNWDISHTSYKIISNKVAIQNRKAKDLSFQNLIKSCDIGLSSVMMKRSLFKQNIKFPNLKTKEDYVLWLKIARQGKTIYAINKILMSWQKSSNSLSSNTLRKLLDGYCVYRMYLSYSVIKSLYSLFILSFNFIKKNN